MCKSEDFYAKCDTKSTSFDPMNKLKEKYLKILSLKTEINSLDFNEPAIKSLITHSFAIGMILVEKALNKTILFEEEQQTFSNLCEMLSQISEILINFQRIFSRISAENEKALHKINELSENIKNLHLERERHEFSIDAFSSSSLKNLLKTNTADPTLTNFINNLHNKFDFEKQKLVSENEKLRVLAQQTQQDDKLRVIEKELKQISESSTRTINEIKSDNEFLSNKIINLEFTSQSQKNLIKNYEQEIAILREKLIEKEKTCDFLTETTKILKERQSIDRETLSMQNEEIFSIKLGFEDKMDIVRKVKENYFSIQNKLNTLTKMNELPKNEDFQGNFQLLTEISQYFKSKPFAKSLSSQIFTKSGAQPPDFNNSSENIDKNSENIGKKADNSDSIHAIELAKYHYYQPTFFTLIESKYKQYEINNKNPDKPDALSLISETMSRTNEIRGDFLLPSTFIATLRGILDSKWHEFAYFSQIKSFSKFPEFVYSWLGKFEVKFENRTVVPSITQDPDEDRCQFLKNLIHPLVDKHWESITFREFLEEKSSLDEVYFYLYCRFLVFKGPQLAHSQGKFCFVHYINFDIVNEIIETVFRNFEEETLNFLKKKLKSKAKIKNNNVLVDSGFVLRVFLEYYRLERKHRFKLLNELFLIKAQSKMYIKYEEFKQILDAFQTNITDLEKAQLYRECYNVGRGKIDPEVIFVVLTENNFFIYTVKTRLSSNLFCDSSTNNNNFDDNNNKIINDYLNLEGKLFDVSNIVGGWGLENLLLELQNYHKIFKKQIQTDNTAFQTKNLLYSYFKLHETLMSIRNYEIFTKNFQKIITQEEILKTELFFYENVYNFVYKIKNREIINEMELNSKAKIIQKWVQNRFSRWLKLLYTIFKVKIHRSKISHSHSVSNVSKSQIKDKKN